MRPANVEITAEECIGDQKAAEAFLKLADADPEETKKAKRVTRWSCDIHITGLVRKPYCFGQRLTFLRETSDVQTLGGVSSDPRARC